MFAICQRALMSSCRCARFTVPTMFVSMSGWLKVERRTNPIGLISPSKSSRPACCQRSHCVPRCFPSDGAPLAAPPRMTIPDPASAAAVWWGIVGQR